MTFESKIDVARLLTPLDWIVFAAILAATLGAVVYGHVRRARSARHADEQEHFLDILVMGRRLTLPLFVATLVATWYGGIFGVTEIAFNHGIYNFITQGLFWYVAYLVFAFFLVDRIGRYQAVTLPDLVTRMFGPRSGKLSAIFNLFNVLPIAYTISIGILLQLIFGGELWIMMSIGVTVVILYSMWGGLRAVVFSDLVQFVVMCSAVALVLIISITSLGGPGFLREHLPPSHFSPTGGMSWGTTLVWGFVALATLVDPNFYQRCFAATSTRTARRGIILSTIIWFAFDICTTFGAMYARAVIPEAEPSHAYLLYALQLLPPGLRGFMLAGIAATILSTLDSYLFLAGTTVSYDLVPNRLKGRVKLHHLGIIMTGILSVVLAIAFEGNIKETWKTLGSYSAACLLLPVMLGHVFPGRIRDNQFILACLLGVAGTTAWRLCERTGFWAEVDALYVGAACTALGLGVYALLARKRRSET
jgi:SSS family solute:Na+ symporter